MIPVTSFAGKTVAVFGLGGSGLASCHALKAGGAEVIAGDDSAERLAEAAKAGFITADLRTVSWANFAALVLTRPEAPSPNTAIFLPAKVVIGITPPISASRWKARRGRARPQ